MGLTTFAGATAVVTGAAHGMGRALAIALGAAGGDVVVADVRGDDAEALAERLTASGARVLGAECDVSSRASVAGLGRRVADWSEDGVQLLCNNAGVFTPRQAANATQEDWEWVLGVNLWGVIHGIAEFLPGMLASGRDAHILTTASMNGYVPSRHSPLCAAAKYGVVGLVESLRLELDGKNVGLTLLNPSAVSTEIGRSEEVRPARYARTREAPPDAPYADFGLGPALPPDAVAALALDGVLAGREVSFTDPVVQALLERGHQRLRAAFDPVADG